MKPVVTEPYVSVSLARRMQAIDSDDPTLPGWLPSYMLVLARLIRSSSEE